MEAVLERNKVDNAVSEDGETLFVCNLAGFHFKEFLRNVSN